MILRSKGSGVKRGPSYFYSRKKGRREGRRKEVERYRGRKEKKERVNSWYVLWCI